MTAPGPARGHCRPRARGRGGNLEFLGQDIVAINFERAGFRYLYVCVC